jgi:CRP-like cAMP-binding protein
VVGPSRSGPSLRAIPFLKAAAGSPVELLSEAQRQLLAGLATIHHYRTRAIVYREGSPAEAVFIISSGAVKAFRDLPSGRRRIAAFLFAHDLFGLAEAGRYVNSVQAIGPVTVSRIATSDLLAALQGNSGLELAFLCKAVHALRQAQRHTIIVGRRHAAGRLAMLLRLLEKHATHPSGPEGIPIPMSRSDIANYLGLSLEAVVRACRQLERQGIVDFVGRNRARILDRARFDALVAAL